MALAGVIAIYDDATTVIHTRARACVPCLSGKGSLLLSSFALLFDDAPEPDDG